MTSENNPGTAQQDFRSVVERRRSTRKFEPGRAVPREALDRIVDCGRWAPSGANSQCWDFIVVDDPDMREAVRQVFLKQAGQLVKHARGFPAVGKEYLKNTVAIILVLGDPRWKVCFPQPTSTEWEQEYKDNNEAIFLCSLGAAIQNIQLGVTAEGLTSAWLSGGGEDTINRDLSAQLGYPPWMKAYGTIPVGYPVKSQDRRYRRPLDQVRHWNRYESTQYRPHAMVDFYESTIRPFAMYRDREDIRDWPDFRSRLGDWAEAFTTGHANPGGELEAEADFSRPRTSGPATKARRS
ncbi:MAG: nitroreductase family protein [Gammaproteobacteria bacterium]|nr:nitroreductase family protein [Gammaproteobacteria bacterium]